MAESLRFFRRIMLLLNAAVCAFLAWVFGMTPVLAARQADGLSFAQNLSALPAKPWTLAVALFGMAALILAGVLRRRGYDRLGWTEPLFAICVIFALHLILFVVYMVVLIGQRTEENSAIRRLNGELEQANDRLSVLNEQLKAYAAESERMAETRERNRLAREIHDTLGHALTGITAGADACLQMLEISPEMAKKQMERIAATAREGMNEVRRSVRALRPDAADRCIRKTVHRDADDLTGGGYAGFAGGRAAPVTG